MTMTLPRILFVHNARTRFVALDIEILRARCQVTECCQYSRRVAPAALWSQVRAHDLVVGWFASWHTFLPVLFARLLGRPALLIIGGYDLANMPLIGYGHQRGGLKKWISRITIAMADCLVTNAHYSREEAQRNLGLPAERVRVIYHGIPDPFGALPGAPRARMALTVGNVDQPNLARKGHEPFVRAAALLPDVAFVLAGDWKDDAIAQLRAIAGPNVIFTGWLDERMLLDYYCRAAVYVQASAHEGFGLSVAEAMLAGCIPVVSQAGALPEVVGNAGILLDAHSPAAIAAGVRAALDAPQERRQQARSRILTAFPFDLRRRMLGDLVDDLHLRLL